jgi:hypothetical protein
LMAAALTLHMADGATTWGHTFHMQGELSERNTVMPVYR